MRHFSVPLPLLLLLTCLIACGAPKTLRVTEIQLGRSVNADSTVAHHTTTFKPGEDVYVSVVTTGAGSGTIGVRWIYEGRLIDEPTKQVAYRDVAATEFRLQSARGFPPGNYRVEVSLDGQSAGTRTFRVETPR
jgi:hypothetical protein